MSNANDIRIAIMGCGIQTQQLYLSALRNLRNQRVTLLIDGNADRRGHLASEFQIEYTHSDVEQCYDLFDAAIVTLPPSLRQPACLKLLAQRKAVLVEQPIALSMAECEAVIRASEQTETVLAVADIRRFLPAHRFAHFLIQSETFGRVKGFDFRNGSMHDWHNNSEISFIKEIAGGGVLMDTGVHTLSCVLRWLGDFSEVEYYDDAEGGVEANALLNLRLENGLSGTIELSRTRELRNTAILHCERGVIEIGLNVNSAKLAFDDQPYVLGGEVANLKEPLGSQDKLGLARALVENFVDAIRTRHSASTDAQLARSTIRLIETSYRFRKPMQFTWAYQEPESA